MSHPISNPSSSSTSFTLPKAPNYNRLPSFLKAGFIHYSKYQNVRNQKFHQRLTVCELLKAKANNLFTSTQVPEAILQYEQALSIYRYVVPKSTNVKIQNIRDEDLEYMDDSGSKKEEYSLIRDIKIALYNNLAACYLKLKDFTNAISACNEVLLLDSTKTKALFRRAKAITMKENAGLPEYKAAKDDLKAAYKLDPKDTAIEQFYIKVRNEITRLKRDLMTSFEKDLWGNLNQKPVEKSVIVEEAKSQPVFVEEKKIQEDSSKMKPGGKPGTTGGKKPEKVEIKEEKVVREHREEQARKDTQETTSTLHTETCEEGKIDSTDVWRMLHGDVDPNSHHFNYELSFEVNPKAKVPEEILEFGKFIERRGKDVIAMYEKAGKTKEVTALMEHLKSATTTHKRIENISKLDFNKPTARLRETAKRLNLDLNDSSFQAELRRMQEKNLEDVRSWLKVAKSSPSYDKPPEVVYKIMGGSSIVAHIKAVQNYFVNNKYFGSGFFSKLFSHHDQSHLITTIKDNDTPDLKQALEKGVTQKELEALLNKGITVVKFIFWCIMTLFCLYVLVSSQERQSRRASPLK